MECKSNLYWTSTKCYLTLDECESENEKKSAELKNCERRKRKQWSIDSTVFLNWKAFGKWSSIDRAKKNHARNETCFFSHALALQSLIIHSLRFAYFHILWAYYFMHCVWFEWMDGCMYAHAACNIDLILQRYIRLVEVIQCVFIYV